MRNNIGVRELNCIDLMKFICSILVVSIHTSPFKGININLHNGYSIITKLTVPFFFITAGYFLFRKIKIGKNNFEENKKFIVKYIKRLTLLYCLWSFIYLLFDLFNWISKGGFKAKYILIYIRDFLFVGLPEILWYFPALICAVIAIDYLLKYLSINKIVLISSIFYFLGLLESSYYGLISNMRVVSKILEYYRLIFYSSRNGLFFGFLFVAIGAFIAMKKNIRYEKNKAYFCYFIISMIFLVIETILVGRLFINNGTVGWVCLIPATVFLFILTFKLKNSNKYKTMRELGVLIYVTHGLFLNLISNSFNGFYINNLVRFLIIFLGSFILSNIIRLLSKDKKFEKLKHFY